jgi:hypothetical protein
MTPQEAFERSLATTSDATNLRGKFLGTATLVAGTPLLLFSIDPQGLGVRPTALAGIYSRYRFKYLRVRFLTNAATIPAGVVMGVLDDVAASGEPPTTVSGLLAYRCSATTFSGETVPVSFEWRPSDVQQWNFTLASTDNRFQIPATLYAASLSAGSFQYEIDYSITFKGAYDDGTA